MTGDARGGDRGGGATTGDGPDREGGGADRISALEGRIRRLQVTVGLLAAVLAGGGAWLGLRAPEIPAVLTVERLEVVEPDGTPALVLANSRRPAVATIDGRVILSDQAEERRNPSIIFFDGRGDEVGGMLFSTRETPDGFEAARHFSLDAYEQDQTVVLAHRQNEEGASAGLWVSDRPLDRSILDAFRELGLEPGVTRAELEAAIGALPEEGREAGLRELFGVSRLFVGSTRERDAALILRDGEGRPRIVIEAPADGEPSIRVLDGAGEEVLRLP